MKPYHTYTTPQPPKNPLQIHNIFSQEKTIQQPSTPNQKISIIIDTREKQSMVSACLQEQNAQIKFEHLAISDYLVGEFAIERKTFSDFISSLMNKRLILQLTELKKYPKPLLIIEGFDYQYHDSKIHENAIRGMLLSVVLDFQIPIIFTQDEEDTSRFLISLAKKQEKNKTIPSLRPPKSSLSFTEQKQFILEGFPGIGPTIAKQLLENFKTLKNILNASETDLEKIKNFHENKIKKFKQLLEN